MCTAEQKNQKSNEPNDKKEDNYNTMKSLSRQSLIAEELIRDHIRKRISRKLTEKKKLEETLRFAIRNVLNETETGTEEASEYTGINVLADLLEKIIPIVEDDYKMLTTSEEQRESFRNHIVHAIKNTLRPIEAQNVAEKIPESFMFNIDKELLAEKVKIDMDPTDDDPADSEAGGFIDIAAPEEDDFVTLDDQNETGRNFAATTFKAVEKQIVDAYDKLADEEDQDLFYDYLITNMLLYFDKFEDELQATLPNITTPEYEKASNEKENETDSDADDTTSEPTTEEPAGGIDMGI